MYVYVYVYIYLSLYVCVHVYKNLYDPCWSGGAGERVRETMFDLEPLFCQTASLGSRLAWKTVPRHR